jgi:Mor family transcriptional regulator
MYTLMARRKSHQRPSSIIAEVWISADHSKKGVTMGLESLQKEYMQMVANCPIDDLPNEDLKAVAKHCGIEVARTILREMAGAVIVVPIRQNLAILSRFINKRFKGDNAKELARAVGISWRQVYRILGSAGNPLVKPLGSQGKKRKTE